MGTCHLAMRAVGILLTIAALSAADAPAKPPHPVTDPVCVGWNNSWTVYRYSPDQAQWLVANSPGGVLRKAVSAIGPHSAAVLDPLQQYGGWLFDLHTQKWEPIPPSPIGGPTAFRDPITVAFIDRQLLVWGLTSANVNGAVLDTTKMQWKPMAPAPVPTRVRAASAVINQNLLVLGGYGHFDPNNPRRFGPCLDGAVYDLAKDVWEKMPAPPLPMTSYGYVSCAGNGRFFLVGGRTGKQISRGGAAFDPVNKTWEVIPDTPFEVGHQSACAFHKDKLFLWSGASPAAAAAGKTIYSTDFAVYDFATQKWQKLPEAPMQPRLLAFAKIQQDQLIIWGGWVSGNQGGEFSTEAASYDVAKGVWQKLPDLPGKTPYALHPGW